ncbi:MAG: hypothetical protein HeimC2_04600 [Candidatus Heimdallarchaeota archaeon LC_2]|nr:MAG: hypothetical protein HeimC2_04600 [Candidatus Heimdallarchaeota archaeon LC_2]
MRHVILGSDTPMGASILRVLVSLGDQEVVCCNPDGIIPTDVPTTNIITFNVDIRKKNMLSAVLKKDDIVYNAQLLDNEDLISNNLIDLHVQGLINLLNVGNEKEVKKIISYLPQKISWEVPLDADEDTVLIPSTEYQKSLLTTLSVAEHYMENKYYDILNLEKEPSQIEVNDKSEEIEDLRTETTEDFEEHVTDEKLSGGPPSLDSTKTPELGLPNLGPSLDPNGSEDNGINIEINEETNIDDSPLDKENKAIEEQKLSSNSEIEEELPILDTSVPLVIARMARFFGPFDEGLTKSYCKAIRLQRIKVIGKLKKKISWINPLDAGRAMTKIADEKVLQNQYNIVGFNATVLELLEELGKVNYSKTKIRKKFYFTRSILIRIKSLIAKIGFIKSINYEEVYGRNKTQVYSDNRALKSWGWKPKYDLGKTSKDSLNWYVNHIL